MPAGTDALTGDVLVAAFWGVDIGGAITGYFTEVSGIGSESEVVEHKISGSGAHLDIVRKQPGRLKWGDITLKRGITASMDIWLWRQQVETGDVTGARKNGTITMYDQESTAVATWEFTAAWPSKVSTPALTADSNAVSVEELTIVHEGIKRLT
ncbi:MAG: phage tail protein [Burkholderiales bacterium]|nr:phage tail protein [Anaerolineae bacterium]